MTNAVQVLVGVEKGHVELSMREDESGRYAQGRFEPKYAYQLGKQLCEHALVAQSGGKGTDRDTTFIDGELKSVRIKITDEQRMALILQATNIIRSMTDQKRTPGQIAVEVVDKVLQETAR